MKFFSIHEVFKDKDGKKIVWHKKNYEDHKKKHDEINSDYDKIRQAIGNPHTITQDVDYKNRTCYYLLFCGRNQYINKSMKVVVVYSKLAINKYSVVSVYYADRIKNGEKIIWTRPKNN